MSRPIDPSQHHQPIQSSGPHHIKNELTKSFNLGSVQSAIDDAKGHLSDMFYVVIKSEYGIFYTPNVERNLKNCNEFITRVNRAIFVLEHESQRPDTQAKRDKYDQVIADLKFFVQTIKQIKGTIETGVDRTNIYVREDIIRDTEKACQRVGEITWVTLDSLK